MMLRSGVSAGDGLAVMAEDEPDVKSRRLLEKMTELADSGMEISNIFKEMACFPKYVEDLVEAGEKTGRLEEAFSSLGAYYDERLRLEHSVRSAMLYPMVLLVVMILVIGVLLVKVMPVFENVYNQLGSGLTGIAGGLLLFGQVLGKAMPVLLVFLIAFIIFITAFAFISDFRLWIAKKWNNKRGHKGISGMLNTAKTAQVLSMCLRSGLSYEETFERAAELMSDVPELSKKCSKCAAETANGAPFAETIRNNELMSLTECRILEVAIKGGLGDEAITDIAGRLMVESEEAFESKLSRIEPVLVTVTSFMVGVILLSVILPLVNIMASIG